MKRWKQCAMIGLFITWGIVSFFIAVLLVVTAFGGLGLDGMLQVMIVFLICIVMVALPVGGYFVWSRRRKTKTMPSSTQEIERPKQKLTKSFIIFWLFVSLGISLWGFSELPGYPKDIVTNILTVLILGLFIFALALIIIYIKGDL